MSPSSGTGFLTKSEAYAGSLWTTQARARESRYSAARPSFLNHSASADRRPTIRTASSGSSEEPTGFNEKILKHEENAVNGIPQAAVSPAVLNAYTEYVYDQAVETWKEMEGEYWVKFWAGF